MKAIPANLGLLILGLIQKVSTAWYAHDSSHYQRARVSDLTIQLSMAKDREIWYQAQIEKLQEKVGISKTEVRSGPYKSGIKPAVKLDYENYIQTRTEAELKKMDEELTEAITSAPVIMHND